MFWVDSGSGGNCGTYVFVELVRSEEGDVRGKIIKRRR